MVDENIPRLILLGTRQEALNLALALLSEGGPKIKSFKGVWRLKYLG